MHSTAGILASLDSRSDSDRLAERYAAAQRTEPAAVLPVLAALAASTVRERA